jgi:hypothetical protein
MNIEANILRADAATTIGDRRFTVASPYVLVTEDWYFLSHRLPMARSALAEGFEVRVATDVDEGADKIRK